jgi:glycosyltransferase involved in cell wall biosynthesis
MAAPHIAFTIIAHNYIKYAVLLARSYKEQHPDHEFYTIFIDNRMVENEHFVGVNIDEIDTIPNLSYLKFKYTILEFSTAVKPFVLSWFGKRNPGTIAYIDPDIYLYKPLKVVYDALENHDCVLTPHLTEPYDDEKIPTEYDIFKSGLYNLGFGAFAWNKRTATYFEWWGKKLYEYGYSDPENHMFTDQKWMDFAPSYLNTYIVKEKGYNVAYWNLHEYVGRFDPKDVTFFHFSGLTRGTYVSKYQNRWTYDGVKEYRTLYDDYAVQLDSLSNMDDPEYTYPYNSFDNGTQVSESIRDIYEYVVSEEGKTFPDPFSTKGENSFYGFLLRPLKSSGKLVALRLFYYLYQTQPLIQATFPNVDFMEEDRLLYDYLQWIVFHAKPEYGIAPEFIREQRKYVKTTVTGRTAINLSDGMNLIGSLEQLKKDASGKQFIERAYKLILGRNVDAHGLKKNLSDFAANRFNKNLLIYRLLRSEEFFSRRRAQSVLLEGYKASLVPQIALDNMKALVLGGAPANDVRSSAPVAPQQESTGMNISGYLDTESGVGESARGMVAAADAAGIEVAINNIEQPWLRRDEKTLESRFVSDNPHHVNLLNVNADQVRNVVVNNLGNQYLGGKYNIGYWYWECDIFPEEYHDAFRLLNEVWVATDFVADSLRVVSPVPVVKIPPAFAPRKIRKPFDFAKHGLKIGKGDFVFLNLFDSGSFWQRKNPFGVIEAFRKVFKDDPTTKLIIKTTNIKDSDIFPKLQAVREELPNLLFLDAYLDSDEVYALEQACDAYIALHKAEGLGIPLIDCMMMGKPVIATDYGGNRDFMNVSNAFPVRYEGFRLPHDIGPYPKDSLWAEADTDHAAEMMKRVRESTPEIAAVAKRGQEFVRGYFSAERIGKLISQRLEIVS